MIIAIEGIDGSGKGTQTRALADAFESAGYKTLVLQFPQYDLSVFGKEVGRYLNGDYGSLEQVHPKFSALLYALDRREAVKPITQALSEGKIVICDRYTGSNVAHQCARVPVEDFDDLANWIRRTEEDILDIPPADIVFLLDVEAHQSKDLVAQKNARTYTSKSHDLHEASDDHLSRASENFRRLARAEGWVRIDCNNSGSLRSRQDITAELFSIAKDAIRTP